jgi:hypothetical protein
MNSITLRTVEGGYTVAYYIKNPDYTAPKEGEKQAVYTPKALHKTRVFTDTEAVLAFIKEHLATLEATDELQADYY